MPYLSPAQCFSSDFRRTTRLSVTRRINAESSSKLSLEPRYSSSCRVEMRSAISCALCRSEHQFQRQTMTVGAADRRNCWALMGAVVKKRRFRIDSRRYLRWNRPGSTRKYHRNRTAQRDFPPGIASPESQESGKHERSRRRSLRLRNLMSKPP